MAITKATASSIAPAAKGDLVVGSGTNDAAVLGVGTNGHTLVADSAETTGLKWQAVSSGGMTLLHTGSMASVSTLDITSISQSYKDLIVDVFYYNPPSGSTYLRLRPNNVTTSIYYNATSYGLESGATSAASYISLGESLSNDGGVADFNSHRLVFVDYTRSYSNAQLIIMSGGFANSTPARQSNNTTFIMETGSAISQLYFYSGANLQRGTIKVYGVN